MTDWICQGSTKIFQNATNTFQKNPVKIGNNLLHSQNLKTICSNYDLQWEMPKLLSAAILSSQIPVECANVISANTVSLIQKETATPKPVCMYIYFFVHTYLLLCLEAIIDFLFFITAHMYFHYYCERRSPCDTRTHKRCTYNTLCTIYVNAMKYFVNWKIYTVS